MTDPTPSLDLRLTPDWLKDSEPANRYADYEGDDPQDRQHRGRRERREERPRRPIHTTERPRSEQGDKRGPQGNRASPTPQRQPESRSLQPRNERPRFQRREETAFRPEVEPALVQVDFLPEERAFSKIIQQIKQGHVAYPLFGLARMFLERPERHRIRIRSLDNQTMIYQFGDHGPVAMDASALERNAFSEKKDEFYETQIVEKEPIKGNFSSVARCTLTGRLLGPTNYHAFQPALRGLYEQRFNRRMSFDEYRRTIEITSDPQAVEQWKEEARKSVTFRTKKEAEPVTFETLASVEQHFRTHYLPSLIRPCLATELSGETARHLPDRGIVAAIRKARERENRFPAQIAGSLRHGLNQAGLHVFKHKKRILYISTVRPQPFDPNQASVSSGLSAILSTIRSYPKISRKQLAERVLAKLGLEPSTGEAGAENQHAKTVLATDLIWLAKAGHVIEFADGTLDLPLPPKAVEAEKAGATAPRHEARDSAKFSPLAAPPASSGPEFEEVFEEQIAESAPEAQHEQTGGREPLADSFEAKDPPDSDPVSPEDTAPEFADATGSAMDVSPEPIELEKSEDADCTPAGSTSHIT